MRRIQSARGRLDSPSPFDDGPGFVNTPADIQPRSIHYSMRDLNLYRKLDDSAFQLKILGEEDIWLEIQENSTALDSLTSNIDYICKAGTQSAEHESSNTKLHTAKAIEEFQQFWTKTYAESLLNKISRESEKSTFSPILFLRHCN